MPSCKGFRRGCVFKDSRDLPGSTSSSLLAMKYGTKAEKASSIYGGAQVVLGVEKAKIIYSYGVFVDASSMALINVRPSPECSERVFDAHAGQGWVDTRAPIARGNDYDGTRQLNATVLSIFIQC